MKKMWIIGVVVILVLFGINLPSQQPSGPAPDTTAPHTTAPIITVETTVPDTTVQETTNPETTVPDTTESATTPAPETTKAPETETPHVHSFGAWEETKTATCTKAGKAKRTCACGESETKAIPAKGHTEVEVPGRDATCAKTGLTDGKKCSVCSVVIVAQETIPLKEHIIVKIPGKPATCTEKGLTDGKECSLCGKVTVTQKDIAANGHTEVTVSGKAATCTEKGLSDGKKCARCGEIITAQTAIPAKGHTEVKVNGKAATCTEKGLTDGKKCSVCGTVTVKQTAISAKGHTEVTVKGKAATCTEKGLTDGKKCTVCDTVTVKQTAIPAKGHTEKTLAAKAATCTNTGLTEGKQCSVCKTVTVAQKSVAAKGHKWDSGTVSGNIKTYKCTVCKATKTETLSTCSHTYGSWQWEAYTFEQYTGDAWFDDLYGPATYTSHRKVRVCSKCGYRDVVDYGDHSCIANLTEKVLYDNCVEGKLTRKTCSICGWYKDFPEESFNHEHIKEFHTYIDQTECTEMTHQLKVTCLDCGSVSYSYPIRPTWEDNCDPALGIKYVAITVPDAYNPNPDPEGINWMITRRNIKYDANGYITSFDIHWHDKDQKCKVATIVVADVKQAFIDWGYTFPEGSRRGVEIAIYDGYYIPMRQTGTS